MRKDYFNSRKRKKNVEKQAKKRPFVNQKSFIFGVQSENFILTAMVECGFEAGDFGRVCWVVQRGYPYLSEMYTVIVPDLLGYGLSDRAQQDELALLNQAKHILKLLDTLNIQQAHFVGHDLGGGIVQILAVRYPERVLSIIVADGVCFANWPLPKVTAMRWPTASEFEPGTALIGQMIRGGVYNPEILTPKVMEAFTAPFATPSGPEELKRASLALDHHQTEDIVPDLQNIKVPVTLLWGQYDPYTTPNLGQKLQEDIPNSKLKILPECSHYSMLDNAVLFSQELLKHLNTQR